MKILLVVSDNFSNRDVVDALTSMLKACGYECYISTTITSNSYHLIFLLNKSSLSHISPFAKEHNIPLIYLFTASTIGIDYPDDYSSAAAFFMIRDFSVSIARALFPSFIKEIRLSYSFKQSEDSYTPKNESRQKVVVALDSLLPSYHTLLKLLPTINLSTWIDFTIVNTSTSLAGILNPHVKQSSAVDDDIFYQSDFVVGSGRYISKAIALRKPCIIAGDRGYGGILDVENFDIQYQHFFQGRAGAELDEHIPPEFLRADIDFLQRSVEALKDTCKLLHKKLAIKEDENIQHFKAIVDRVQNQYYQANYRLHELCLEQSGTFSFIPTSEGYLMIKAGCKTLYSKISKNDMAVISSFTNPCTYDEAFQKIDDENYSKEEFVDFTKELLDEKVLQVKAE